MCTILYISRFSVDLFRFFKRSSLLNPPFGLLGIGVRVTKRDQRYCICESERSGERFKLPLGERDCDAPRCSIHRQCPFTKLRNRRRIRGSFDGGVRLPALTSFTVRPHVRCFRSLHSSSTKARLLSRFSMRRHGKNPAGKMEMMEREGHEKGETGWCHNGRRGDG